MTEYYFDLETTGLDFKKDKIITIQYQRLDRRGCADGDLVILKEWESSEKEIISSFLKIFEVDRDWNFIPIGMNLGFEFCFLHNKVKDILGREISLETLFYKHPYVDIKPILVIANEGKFSGCSLDRFSKKTDSGHEVPVWYSKKEYSKIEKYIENEANAFLELYQIIRTKIPSVIKSVRP